MTNEEAIHILDNLKPTNTKSSFDAYVVGKAITMAIKALETIPKYKDAYNKGWDDGAKASYEHLKMCEEEQEPKTDVFDKIRAEIDKWHHLTDKAFNDGIDTALEIIDKYKAESEE